MRDIVNLFKISIVGIGSNVILVRGCKKDGIFNTNL